MIDMLAANSVQVLVDTTGKLWVNIDGKCELRIGHCKLIVLDDPDRGEDVVYEDKTAVAE